MMFRKVLRVGKYATVGAITGGSVYILHENEWDISSIGAVRFGRAAFAALQLAVDYKLMFRKTDRSCSEYPEILSQTHLKSAMRLRDMCSKNGGVFIKVAQHVGSLEYILPIEYVNTMKIFHNKAPQSSVEDVQKVIESDLGKKMDELFDEFEPEPLGAASLAQVHKAKLKDGREVAVKVQHPKVKAHSFVDMKTMEFLVHGIAYIFPDFKYLWLAEETKRNLPKELDFLQEGKNCEQVERLFKHFSFLKVPKIYWDVSSEKVLTMEYCEGGKVDDREYMKSHGISVNEVSQNLGKLYSEMIFVHGFVHCDPHPGNVLVNKTKYGSQLVLLDHGLYTTLTDSFRVSYTKLWMALINADMKAIEKHAKALNAGDLYPLFACMLTARSWDAINTGIDKTKFTEQEDSEIKTNVTTYFIQISEVLNRVPREMLLILKTNDVLRSIEMALKTRASATSFINMSRCCVRSLTADKLLQCHNFVQALKIRLICQWQLFRINVYELCLWIQSSPFMRLFHRNSSS